jgi:excinuclease ABC subunit A
MSEPKIISVKGARVHNLKNINVEIPKNKFVVITGKSGSGKSSLAFDTVFAEGQRRYVESLSAYARQFLEQMQKPDVDSIEGLSPAIAIEQKTVSKNPRSTVATITEIYDYLRVLFARVGTPFCYMCGKEISSQTVQEMVDRIKTLPPGEKIMVLSPIIRGRKGEFHKELKKLQKEGFVRARIDGKIIELSSEVNLDKNRKHTIEVVVDRLIVKDGIEKRLADSLQTAINFSEGIALISPFESGEFYFNENLACVNCGISYAEVSPRSFSFNSPYGACPSCSGIGTRTVLDPDLVISDINLSINDGAIASWPNSESFYVKYLLKAVLKHYGFSLDVPLKELPDKIINVLLHGSGDEKIQFVYEDDTRTYKSCKPFEGILNSLNRRYLETDSDKVREELSMFMNHLPCPDCGGKRLKQESLAIKINGKSIYDFTAMTVDEAVNFVSSLNFSKSSSEIANPLLKEIKERLNCLSYLGLSYLTLDRLAGTLSGGESHRINLATQLGTRLTGVLYVLDEPSVGLHTRDTDRLLQTLKDLRDIGNSIIVVEHDKDTILESDYVIDLGPGAGTEGGEVVAAGTPKQIMNNKKSLTGQYLSGCRKIPLPKERRLPGVKNLILRGASENNLKNIDVSIPLGLFVCITGVSGSGKSSLVFDTLLQALSNHLYRRSHQSVRLRGLDGVEFIDKVINVDQSPIGRTPRSNPATFTGLFNHIRDIFAKLPESRIRGYKPGRFSFNVKGGRCEACQGDGLVKIEMHFLPDIYVTCDVCQGKRYNRETLEVCYKGKNISDILAMTVSEALLFFENIPSVKNKLQVLNDVGLDYITLGQQATTLSGGEAQRIKLSRELSKKGKGHTLYILDEPTTGLHFADIQKLLEVLNNLVDRGNTLIVIEHNMEVIKTADYIIDVGPEGGEEGGYIVGYGTPEEITKKTKSYTGRYLKKHL